MIRFDAPIEKFYRDRWYRFSLSVLEWTYYGNLNTAGTLKVKLQKTNESWVYSVHRNNGTNYVVVVGRPSPNQNHAVLSGMLWVERHFGKSAVANQGARVVRLDEYKARVAQQRAAKVRSMNDPISA